MDTWPRISALGMLLMAAFGYVFSTPLRFLAKTRYPANPQLQLIDTERLPLPQLVQQHFDAADVEPRQAGFEPQGTLLAAGHVANVSSLFCVYANRDAMDLAIVTSVFVTAKDRAARHFPFMQFSSRWATGWGLLTSNPTVMSVFPPRPNVLAVHAAWIVDVTKLYQVHRAVGSATGPAVRKVERLFAEFQGDVATFFAAVMREEMEDAARAGYLRPTADGTQYQPTIMGAYLMTWKALPPFMQLFTRYREREARRLLAEVGAR